MHKVDRYFLKGGVYVFILANIIAYFLPGEFAFLWLNLVALALCLLLFSLVGLTARRYAEETSKNRSEIVNLQGNYIEDDKRCKVSFYDYLQRD